MSELDPSPLLKVANCDLEKQFEDVDGAFVKIFMPVNGSGFVEQRPCIDDSSESSEPLDGHADLVVNPKGDKLYCRNGACKHCTGVPQVL